MFRQVEGIFLLWITYLSFRREVVIVLNVVGARFKAQAGDRYNPSR